jgi:hypothetical protein
MEAILDFPEFHWKTFLWETTQQIEFFALYECSLDGLVPESNMAARANNVLFGWNFEDLVRNSL